MADKQQTFISHSLEPGRVGSGCQQVPVLVRTPFRVRQLSTVCATPWGGVQESSGPPIEALIPFMGALHSWAPPTAPTSYHHPVGQVPACELREGTHTQPAVPPAAWCLLCSCHPCSYLWLPFSHLCHLLTDSNGELPGGLQEGSNCLYSSVRGASAPGKAGALPGHLTTILLCSRSVGSAHPGLAPGTSRLTSVGALYKLHCCVNRLGAMKPPIS